MPPDLRRWVTSRRARGRRGPGRGAALAAAAAVLGATAGLTALGVAAAGGASAAGSGVRVENRFLDVVDGPRDDQHVRIDTTLYLPSGADRTHPAPAVIGSHGFGGDKTEMRSDAQALARAGYVVLLYSARGFGASGGQVALDSPDYEVKDVHQLVDYLATRPEVQLDAPGDPRVGLVGESYGGGISLLAAAYDRRVDAVVPVITWSSLVAAFSPNAVAGQPGGVFKQQWAGVFFGLSPAAVPQAGSNPLCGHFTAEVCQAYTASAQRGQLTPQAVALLARSSPAGVIGRIKVPTLLVQGESDTLFPLDQAVANARGIAANGAPVAQVWLRGGHDAPFGSAETSRIRQLTTSWFDHYLRGRATALPPALSYVRPDAGGTGTAATVPRATTSFALTGDGRLVPGAAPAGTGSGPRYLANPPGGRPAAVSGLPGLGSLSGGGALGGLSGLLSLDLPGQNASFTSAPLAHDLAVAGLPTVTLQVTSSSGAAVLFAKLYDVDAGGTAALPQAQTAPMRLTALPRFGTGRTVEVTLAGISHRFPSGHRLRLVLASTDEAYAPEAAPALIGIAPGRAGLALPAVPVAARAGAVRTLLVAAAALAAVLACLAAVTLLRRRRTRLDAAAKGDPMLTPVVVSGLTKSYPGGLRAVDDLSLTVERGQVLGLLGPNGAGKTTALRMLLGLITPSAGVVTLFGEKVRPGAPVLGRVGAFVEGTGSLPHLSGLDNLELYWRSNGADLADAHLDAALEVAGLGDAIHRPVRTYSQGMRQRLALAQALLGDPDLLVLDEPTNGLDPPQIREMRELVRRVAASGRTVLLSSHLLAEVEQTCTHVAVMAHGRLIAAGPVAELVGGAHSVHLDVADPTAALPVLRGLHGVSSAARTADGALVAELDGTGRADVVRELVGAGVAVEGVSARRRLEDVFLGLVEDDDAAAAGRQGGAAGSNGAAPAHSPTPTGRTSGR